MIYANRMWGAIFIIAGLIILFFALGDLLFRIMMGLLALSLINHGLRLRGLPPLQFLVPMWFNRRWF